MTSYLKFFAGVLTTLLLAASVRAYDDSAQRLAENLRPFLSCISGERATYSLSAEVKVDIDGRRQQIAVRLVRHDDQAFDLELKHTDYWVQVRRRADICAFALPHHKVVFLGRGDVDAADHLAPAGISRRLIGPGSMVSAYVPLVQRADAAGAALLLRKLLKLQWDAEKQAWTAGNISFHFPKGNAVNLQIGTTHVLLQLEDEIPSAADATNWPDLKVVELPRRDLERQLARGVRRALEIVAPSPTLTLPEQTDRKVANGELRWVEGQRVVLLHGTPEEIGRAHGELLQTEAQRCMDSVLYAFGTLQTVQTGRWFQSDLLSAYKRLAPHIPPDHQRELHALAKAMELDKQLVETVNVFPELFHCSGFAVFGEATKDGKLYHGRVLDYMTMIGLQDAATTFIVAVDGKIPFANIGYAGFTGCVSGMNSRAISLGEMGGRGEGKWDGAPMATLMRRGLEECSTLDEVIELWKKSPRTCEYYYVFADGKSNRAVGVSATPEAIEFVLPGQSHERLGDGIKDAVILSAGSRLEKLRERVTERYGQIDATAAQGLMCRPVAMESNLHNVLFVPEDGIFYVANANHKQPAAERPYAKLDLHALLKSMKE